MTDRTTEMRLRRALKRRGLELHRSRRRDSRAIGFGGYLIRDPATGVVIKGSEPFDFSMSLKDVEEWLRL